MVTLGNAEPNTWSEHELQECDLDKETDTCVGVRDVLSYMRVVIRTSILTS